MIDDDDYYYYYDNRKIRQKGRIQIQIQIQFIECNLYNVQWR